MRVVLLGTGGYHPSEERHTACLMFPELGIVFDAGTAAFRIADRLVTREIDLFLSHAHLDHIAGLTYLLAPLSLKQLDALRIHATEHVIAAVREHLFATAIFPVMPRFDFLPMAGPSLQLGEATIRWQVLPSHPGTSMAYRIESTAGGKPRSLAYVTDTTVDGSYTDFIRGADVLIHECYFPDSHAEWAQKTGHSTTSTVLDVAAAANVGRLILVHVDPRSKGDDPLSLTPLRSKFPAVEIARDGLEFRL